MTLGLQLRFFVISRDGSLYGLSTKALDSMTSRKIKMPEFAGKDMHIAQVRIACDAHGPTQVLSAQWHAYPFDAKGRFDESACMKRAMDQYYPTFVKLLGPATTRQRRRKSWSPSPSQRAQLRSAALGRIRLAYFKVPRAPLRRSTAKS